MSGSLLKSKKQLALAVGIVLIMTALCLLTYVLMVQLRTSILS
jgi:hypothetical protein